jgi:hypothetical protein
VVVSFWASFLVTLVLFAGAVVTGWRGRRRAHFVLAPLAIAMLAVTIVLTERLVQAVVFPEHEMRIHLALAKTAAGLVLLAAATGLATVRFPAARRIHRVAVIGFLVATVAATCTGIWVFSLSTPR